MAVSDAILTRLLTLHPKIIDLSLERVWRLFDKLGAHALEFEGVAGTHFAVWAPNARRVSVVGDFNDWDGRRDVMRHRRDPHQRPRPLPRNGFGNPPKQRF